MQAEFGGGEEAPNPSHPSLKPKASSKEGFLKIRYTCEQAAKQGLEWAWVDTCCIDKTSSAELSEAINSMYRWYNRAKICYAYLSDVTLDLDIELGAYPPNSPSTTDSGSHPAPDATSTACLDLAIASSRWLTRGFTLQELLAPNDVEFYSSQWTELGTRNEELLMTLANATGIDAKCLKSGDHARLAYYNIATRMSWASRRSCTRVEDVAYCLMGIFDINMPMLYGEGKKAFVRLQEEILKDTEDHSLFAWVVPETDDRAWRVSSILAESPSDFARSGNIRCPKSSHRGVSTITKLGLSIELNQLDSPKVKEPCYLYDYPYVLQYFTLDCCFSSGSKYEQIKIALLSASKEGTHDASIPSFCRLVTPKLEAKGILETNRGIKRIHIRKNLSPEDSNISCYTSSIWTLVIT